MSAKTDKDAYHIDRDVELSQTAVIIERNRTSTFTYLLSSLAFSGMRSWDCDLGLETGIETDNCSLGLGLVSESFVLVLVSHFWLWSSPLILFIS